MVKDHSDSERGNPLPPHGLLLPISSKGSFICTIPQTHCTYHGICYTSRGALAGTRNSSMGPPHEGSIQRPIAPWANALTTELQHFNNILILIKVYSGRRGLGVRTCNRRIMGVVSSSHVRTAIFTSSKNIYPHWLLLVDDRCGLDRLVIL